MLSPYRSILATPGARLWSVAGFLARMPISMVTLAIVLLIAGRTGSYGLAGTVSAAYMLAAAVSAPMLARLIDGWGQARVLLPSVTAFALGMGGLIVAVEQSWSSPVPHLFVAVAGVCYPPVGACVRARWAAALSESGALHTAYSFEAVVDEAIFMAGPVIVTLLATSVNEILGVAVVVLFAVGGGVWLASLRGTEPPARGSSRLRAGSEAMGWGWLMMLVLAAACLGTLFGSTEVVTVAFAQEQGHRALAGVLLAAWAAGSLIAGIITGSVHWKAPPMRRYRRGSVAMACVMLPLPFVGSIPLLAGALFVAGFAISPTLVAVVSLVQAQVPASRLTEGITWVMTGVGLGIAPGAAVAGRLIDEYGASAAYSVPVIGGALAAVVASLTPARDERCADGAEVRGQEPSHLGAGPERA
ncbi:MAG: MFS transporter [Nocardioidaceae bacterium]